MPLHMCLFYRFFFFLKPRQQTDRQGKGEREKERERAQRERQTDGQTVGKVIELSANSESKGKRQNLLIRKQLVRARRRSVRYTQVASPLSARDP